jgi:hypothetical protein
VTSRISIGTFACAATATRSSSVVHYISFPSVPRNTPEVDATYPIQTVQQDAIFRLAEFVVDVGDGPVRQPRGRCGRRSRSARDGCRGSSVGDHVVAVVHLVRSGILVFLIDDIAIRQRNREPVEGGPRRETVRTCSQLIWILPLPSLATAFPYCITSHFVRKTRHGEARTNGVLLAYKVRA